MLYQNLMLIYFIHFPQEHSNPLIFLKIHCFLTNLYQLLFPVIQGVDWKSLCLPACLPITTDYFPEDRSLHNDYVVADYNLLPEDMNEHARGRKTLDTTQVFLELVSQRLAQVCLSVV